MVTLENLSPPFSIVTMYVNGSNLPLTLTLLLPLDAWRSVCLRLKDEFFWNLTEMSSFFPSKRMIFEIIVITYNYKWLGACLSSPTYPILERLFQLWINIGSIKSFFELTYLIRTDLFDSKCQFYLLILIAI